MNLNHMMNEQTIALNMSATNKLEALEAMAGMLHKAQRLTSLNEFLVDVMAREAVESTNMEIGVAIPHSKSSTILKSSICIGRLTHAIDWEDDGEPVRIIFMLAVSPKDEGITHLEVIAKLAELLIEDEFIDLLNKATNNVTIINYIEQQLG